MVDVSQFNRTSLCELLPHTGSMCLIDRVIAHDDEQIIVESDAHLRRDHPLRVGGGLTSISLIELAAQAMALHSAIGSSTPMGEGFLASLRQVSWADVELSNLKTPITIRGQLLARDSQGLAAHFQASAEEMTLVSGRLTVMMKKDSA